MPGGASPVSGAHGQRDTREPWTERTDSATPSRDSCQNSAHARQPDRHLTRTRVSRRARAPRARRRRRHGHHAVLARRLHQPLLRRAEPLRARPGPRDPPGVRQGRRRDPRDQHLRRQPRRGWPPSAWPRSCAPSTRPACGWRARPPGDAAFVAGAMGPLGVRIEPLGPTRSPRRATSSASRSTALVEAGVDLLILETFSNLDELREAIFAAREAAGDGHGHRRPGHHRRLRATCPAATPRDLHRARSTSGPST